MTSISLPSRSRARSGLPDDLVVPIDLACQPMRAVAMVHLADDPVYRGLEPQLVPHPGGEAVAVVGHRHDGAIDVVVDHRLDLDRGLYEPIGRGVATWSVQPVAPGRLDVTTVGLHLDVGLTDPQGRRVELRIVERDAEDRRTSDRLSTVGRTMGRPTSLPLLWLEESAFVQLAGTEIDLRVDGRPRTTGRLPTPPGGRPATLTRYGVPTYARLAPARHGPAPMAVLPDDCLVRLGDGVVEVVPGRTGLAAARVEVRGRAHVAVHFDPCAPDPRALPDGARRSGRLAVTVDRVEQIEGRWAMARDGDRVGVVARPGPWAPPGRVGGGSTRGRRGWPATYRWQAVIDLDREVDRRPVMASAWHRAA